MSGFSKNQVYTIIGAFVLLILLYLAPTNSKENKNNESRKSGSSSEFNFQIYLDSVKNTLNTEQLTKLNQSEISLEKVDESILYDSLGKTWDIYKQPGISAYYFEKLSSLEPNETNYLNTAYRFFDAYKLTKDSISINWMLNKAIRNYTKVLELNPNNLDAKTDLGVLYAEGTSDPMKGIMLLREVLKANPNHENAQMNMGILSLKSQQHDKALGRFKKVLEINPKNINAYIYLGNTYLEMGSNEKAIESFEKIKTLNNDPLFIQDLNKYIDQIKKHNIN